MKVNDRVQFYGYLGESGKGTIVEVKSPRCILVKEDRTTTNYLTELTLRKDGTFVPKGWTMDEKSHCGYVKF